jgi:hypothetical protein
MGLSVAILVAVCAQAAPAQPLYPPATVALATTFADGRVQYDLVSAKPSWWWGSSVPRIASWAPPEGTAPFRALKIARRLVGNDVEVAVSLLRGPLMSDEQPIRVMTIARGARVAVPELSTYGFEPIVLSLADAVPMTPFLPSVVSVTPEIEISDVDTLSAPYPGYRVRLRNLSSKTIATFHVRAYGRPDKSISTVKTGEHGRPAMVVGGEYTFDVNLTGASRLGDGSVSPTPLDVIEIDSVVWADGTTTGPQVNAAATAIPNDAGQRLMIERALDILREVSAGPSTRQEALAEIRLRFQALPIDADRLPATRNAMRATRATLIADLTRFENDRLVPHDDGTIRQWMAYTIARYQDWLKRLATV